MLNTATFPVKIKKNDDSDVKIKNKNTCKQYGVNRDVFNPDKFSPPNQWSIRLLSRFSRSKTPEQFVCNTTI